MFLDREGLGGRVRLGEGAVVDSSASVDTSGDITIDAWAVVSEEALILTHEHDWRNVHDKAGVKASPLHIGEHAFIGARAIILPQVTEIGARSVIGAGSVVTRNVMPGQTVAGNPARPIRS
jgi:acetyltransferase-like isoleucine patch superfamily enzyme